MQSDEREARDDIASFVASVPTFLFALSPILASISTGFRCFVLIKTHEYLEISRNVKML